MRNRNGKNRGVAMVMAIAGAVCTSPLSGAWTLTSPVGTVQAPYVLNHQSNIACNGDCPMGDQGGILKVQNPNGPVWQQQQTVSVGPMSMTGTRRFRFPVRDRGEQAFEMLSCSIRLPMVVRSISLRRQSI